MMDPSAVDDGQERIPFTVIVRRPGKHPGMLTAWRFHAVVLIVLIIFDVRGRCKIWITPDVTL